MPFRFGSRKIVIENTINRAETHYKHLKFDTVEWNKSVASSINPDFIAQEEIYNQLGDYNIYIGMVHSKFGTPTAQVGSGTEDEFDNALVRYKEKRLLILVFGSGDLL